MSGPVFIIAPLRSGGALLADALARSAGGLAVRGRIDAAIKARCGERERLTAADATPEIVAALRADLASDARLLDASPRHASRVPFLQAVFPDGRFVYVYREPRRAVYDLGNLHDVSAEELTQPWCAVTNMLLDDLDQLPPGSWMIAAYDAIVEQPETAIARVADFLELSWDGMLPPKPEPLKTPPSDEIRKLDVVDVTTRKVADRVRDLMDEPPARASGDWFRSVSTQSFPDLLRHLGISLLVSTYQSGRLILVRAESTTTLNTHFRRFANPMGIAVGNGRVALGTEREVWEFRNMPAVAAKLEPAGKHDACFMPRKIHVTGDIRIHEIGFAAGELWMVNTRLSALCTLDADSTFVPQWRPPFITRLAAEDRCHLNGMAIIDDCVRFVTALGVADTPGGWRENKARGGVLLDVPSGEIVLHGLSMPHSPRRYGDHFFILESGKGSIAAADLATGRVDTIAELPGFTRGLAFAGPFAFVGLSQMRESKFFSGIPLTERVAELECGVYAIDLRNGAIAAFLRFEGDVRELFDVQVLHGAVYPELLELNSPLVAASYSVPDDKLHEFAEPE
ncbi:MAG: hypothetical protein QOI58_3848 [Thermoanaerobaculia bacterium]|jgi:uncharacterized protein (TIGR03032 family)|nr:hypothetical protein [Thermoanaerobaculia bacterium]